MAALTTTYGIPASPLASKASIWTARILAGLVALFLAFDGLTKVFKERHVLAAIAEMGISVSSIVWIGAVLLACTALYLIPRTSIFGAMLLTAYLGGAVCANVLAHHGVFEAVFPIIFGVAIWGSIYLREPRLRALAPFRREQA
jgi:hypothetical protein